MYYYSIFDPEDKIIKPEAPAMERVSSIAKRAILGVDVTMADGCA